MGGRDIITGTDPNSRTRCMSLVNFSLNESSIVFG